eukprot:maker-scaffold616_size123561-snap-gene-0.23 protein:Tk05723 transcript:maker-scaffold616_size123561-snap-gene-0.23-mRNA-1 annotation:"hypothetical protein"
MTKSVESKNVVLKRPLRAPSYAVATTMSNRKGRAKIAHETLDIIKLGEYEVQEETIHIAQVIENSIRDSVCFSEEQLQIMRAQDFRSPRIADQVIEVTYEQAISASQRLWTQNPNCHIGCLNFASAKNVCGGMLKGSLAQEESLAISASQRLWTQNPNCHIGCLNFASAKNVCGGMLKGSLAQEESLGLCSSLFPCLDQFQEEFYQVNRSDPRKGVYHDNLIYSPKVQIFREDGQLRLLTNPYTVSFITCPAVNKGSAMQRHNVASEDLNQAMKRRIENVLLVAVAHKIDILILGAWGCGVFANEPLDVAGIFREALIGDNAKFAAAFTRITFAIGSDEAKVKVFRDNLVLLTFRRGELDQLLLFHLVLGEMGQELEEIPPWNGLKVPEMDSAVSESRTRGQEVSRRQRHIGVIGSERDPLIRVQIGEKIEEDVDGLGQV